VSAKRGGVQPSLFPSSLPFSAPPVMRASAFYGARHAAASRHADCHAFIFFDTLAADFMRDARGALWRGSLLYFATPAAALRHFRLPPFFMLPRIYAERRRRLLTLAIFRLMAFSRFSPCRRHFILIAFSFHAIPLFFMISPRHAASPPRRRLQPSAARPAEMSMIYAMLMRFRYYAILMLSFSDHFRDLPIFFDAGC